MLKLATRLRLNSRAATTIDLLKCLSCGREQIKSSIFESTNFVRTIATDSTEPTDTRLTIDFMQDVNDAADVTNLLKVIELHVNELTIDQIDRIYSKIFELGVCKIDYLPETNFEIFNLEFVELLNASPVFQSLLGVTVEKFFTNDSMTSRFQIKLFKILILMKVSLENEIVELLLRNLSKRIDSMQLFQLVEFQRLLMICQRRPRCKGLFSNLTNTLLRAAENKLLQDEFDFTDLDKMIESMDLFLVKRCHDAIAYLTEIFLSTERQLDYSQAVNLMRVLKKINDKNNHRLNTDLETNLTLLIDKCNRVIIQHLTHHPTDENCLIYVHKLAIFIDGSEFNLRNFYNSKVLELLSPILISNKDRHNGLFIYKIAYNYLRFNICNEQLLKRLYELACNDNEFRSQFGIGTFFLLFRFKFPFFDYRRLAELLLTRNSNEIDKLIETNYQPVLRFICELMLCSVYQEKMLDYLDSLANRESFRKLSSRDLKLVNLTNSYLSTSGEELEDKIKSKFKSLHNRISTENSNAPVDLKNNLFKIDGKIFEHCHLNGVYLYAISIYDKSICDLVPLTDYRDYFDKLDQILLKDDHELLTFIQSASLKGNFGIYDSTFNVILKQILSKYKIKPVEVDFAGFSSSRVEKATYLIKMALNSYEK